jgi:hypothetical protein
MGAMPLFAWISLLFLVVALAGSTAVAATRALRAWRTFRRFSRITSAGIDDVLKSSAAVEERVGRLGESTERLNAALAHLEHSRAELEVIRAAAAEAQSSVLWFRGAVPRK